MGRTLRRQAGRSVTFFDRLSREELREEYRGAAALLVPNVEDFGMVAVEALACGTPVVGLVGSGTADTVVPGVHGELAAEGSVPGLVAACRTVLAARYDATELRRRAENFSTRRFQRRFGLLLERLVPAIGRA